MKTVKNGKQTTIFKTYEENGIGYRYDSRELRKAFEEARAKKHLTFRGMCYRIDVDTNIPQETVLNHMRMGAWHRNPNNIKTVKKYGEYLCKDEYAFLKPFLTPNEVCEKPPEEPHSDPIKFVFSMLYDILALYEASGCYDHIPGTDDADGAWEYFEGLIGNVRKKLTVDLFDKRDSEEYWKLERIIDETEVFVKSYSVPGVVKRWREINLQINYFDPVFELINELGMERVQLLYSNGMLDVLPSDYIIKARYMYFAKRAMQNDNGNLRYTETRLFQNELLQTLAMVFENDFGSKE